MVVIRSYREGLHISPGSWAWERYLFAGKQQIHLSRSIFLIRNSHLSCWLQRLSSTMKIMKPLLPPPEPTAAPVLSFSANQEIHTYVNAAFDYHNVLIPLLYDSGDANTGIYGMPFTDVLTHPDLSSMPGSGIDLSLPRPTLSPLQLLPSTTSGLPDTYTTQCVDYVSDSLTIRRTPDTVTQTTQPQCFDHGCNGRTFSCLENYKRHLRERERRTHVICGFCHTSFSRKSNRDQHIVMGRCKASRVYSLNLIA